MPLDRKSSIRDLVNGDAFVSDFVGAVPDGGTEGQALVTLDPGSGDIEFTSAGDIIMAGRPTSDPGVAGALWRSGNDLKISTG